MSTPYAAGAQLDGMEQDKKPAGMHFPLREGTEVLIAFLNGDPDLPVIVGRLPNAEANSVVGQVNTKEHVQRTPGGGRRPMELGRAAGRDRDGKTREYQGVQR